MANGKLKGKLAHRTRSALRADYKLQDEIAHVYAQVFRLRGMTEGEIGLNVRRRLADANISQSTLQKAMGQLAAAYKAKGARIPKPAGRKMQELQRKPRRPM